MAYSPRVAGKFIAENATHVKIHEAGIKKLGDELVAQINSGTLSVENFSQNNVHPNSLEDPWAADWLFVVDTLNFCFWSHETSEGWSVDSQTGYFALCAAINRAMKENVDILNPSFYAYITHEQLSKVLRSDNGVPIPLLPERLRVLHETGVALLEMFDGSFVNVIQKANSSAMKLLNLITESFPCFRDVATYKGIPVCIYKRAQILVGDIWACYKNQGLGYFEDINELTMFADYRVPQSLLYYGVFEYGEELMKKFEEGTLFVSGEEMEVEIRGCSIHAVELLKKYAASRVDADKMCNAVLIDHFLWEFRRKHAREIVQMKLPFHKTLCIYY